MRLLDWLLRKPTDEEHRRRFRLPVRAEYDIAYAGMSPEEAQVYNRAFNAAMCFTRIGQTMEHEHFEPELEDTP